MFFAFVKGAIANALKMNSKIIVKAVILFIDIFMFFSPFIFFDVSYF